MKRAAMRIRAVMLRLRRDTSGATAMIVAIALPALLGMMAYAIDTSRVYTAQRELQAATDAAALAGAQGLSESTAKAIQYANDYSALSTKHNAYGPNAAMVQGFPQVACIQKLNAVGEVTCLATGNNAIKVQQKLTVPLLFGPVIGINNQTVFAQATAAARGGSNHPVNIAIIVDVTGSMTNERDGLCGLGPATSTTGPTKLDCAKQGVLTLLGQLNPANDSVALLAFPSAKSGEEWKQTDCISGTTAAAQAYGSSAKYVLASLTKDYAGSIGSLNIDSLVVRGVSSLKTNGGAPSCRGMDSLSGVSTYYADAITAAQNLLKGHAGQNAIILLTDGDANTGPTGVTANRCQKAVDAARLAVDDGTWVYAIGYATKSSSGCSSDTKGYFNPSLATGSNPRPYPCDVLRNIAVGPKTSYTPLKTRFFSTTVCTGAQDYASLTDIFQEVAASLKNTRLIPNDWQ